MATWETLKKLTVVRRDEAPLLLKLLGYPTVITHMTYVGMGWRKGKRVAMYKTPTNNKYKFYTLSQKGKPRRVR